MRCCGWSKKVVLMLAMLALGCGGTGGGSSGSGNQFVFQARGRITLTALVDINNPTVLTLIATLLDPRGNPFPNERITFEAEFADVTFIPPDRNPATCDPLSCSNRGAAISDDNGQVQLTLIAGLTTGRMRVFVEAPARLNLASGISVLLNNQGFVSRGPLGIIPVEVLFVNPVVGPNEQGPMATFNAVGGTPPYQWNNSNQNLGRIALGGIPNVNEQITYTLLGPVTPTEENQVLEDSITLSDTDASQANATVRVVFADCTLRADGTEVTLLGVPGAQFQVDLSDGVPPFSVTETFPGSVLINVVVVDANGNIIPGQACDQTGERCQVIFTLPSPPAGVEPDTILIRDARGCTADVSLTVELCGNGVIDAGDEECDGGDFGGLTCTDFTGPGSTGILRCSNTCTIDDSACQEPMMMP